MTATQGVVVSVKIRARILDKVSALHKRRGQVTLVQEESGPELVVYLAEGASGARLSPSVVDLIVTMIRARAEGIKRGDVRGAPIELVLRASDKRGKVLEEKIIRLDSKDPAGRRMIQESVDQALTKMLPNLEKRKARAV